jgi:hypothetical protein
MKDDESLAHGYNRVTERERDYFYIERSLADKSI